MVRIDGTSFGEVLIDGKTYYSDMIVWWDGKLEHRAVSHELDMSEFVKLLRRRPEAIVVGTGQSPPRGGLNILPEVLQAAEDQKVDIFSEISPKAIQIFNGLVADKKKAVALIHATC